MSLNGIGVIEYGNGSESGNEGTTTVTINPINNGHHNYTATNSFHSHPSHARSSSKGKPKSRKKLDRYKSTGLKSSSSAFTRGVISLIRCIRFSYQRIPLLFSRSSNLSYSPSSSPTNSSVKKRQQRSFILVTALCLSLLILIYIMVSLLSFTDSAGVSSPDPNSNPSFTDFWRSAPVVIDPAAERNRQNVIEMRKIGEQNEKLKKVAERRRLEEQIKRQNPGLVAVTTRLEEEKKPVKDVKENNPSQNIFNSKAQFEFGFSPLIRRWKS